jgi:hypothetical protein
LKAGLPSSPEARRITRRTQRIGRPLQTKSKYFETGVCW